MFFQCLHDLDARNALVGGPIAKVEKNVEALPDTPGDLIDRGRLPQILHLPLRVRKKRPRIARPVIGRKRVSEKVLVGQQADTHKRSPIAYCSGFTPAVEITLAHLAISSSRNLPASAGVLPTASMPMVSKRALMSAEATALAVSAAIRLTISRGVPAGARNKTQVEPSISGPPASAMVGTSAAPTTRLAENMPSALILPARTCGISVLGTSTRIWMFPPIRSCSAGAVPL